MSKYWLALAVLGWLLSQSPGAAADPEEAIVPADLPPGPAPGVSADPPSNGKLNLPVPVQIRINPYQKAQPAPARTNGAAPTTSATPKSSTGG